jgi:pyruvate,water dikinase
MVEETPMPADIEAEIRRRYQEMCHAAQQVDLAVATRSAGPASHPGQYESYLHLKGGDAVVDGVRRVWSSTFNQRSLIARARQGLDLAYDPIGVAVLRMVEAKAAGVMFTTNPRDGDSSKVYIEANWGLGESVVSGEVTPDSFLVAKDGAEIIERHICQKQMWFVPDPETGEVGFCQVPDAIKGAPALSDDELREIARVGVLIEQHFGEPQDIEWAIAGEVELPESVMFLQTRPQKGVVEKKDATDRLLDFITRDFEF